MKKLDMRGFSHQILLLLVVIGVAIAGCLYLVSSHADTYGNPTTSQGICEGAHYRRVWKSNRTCSNPGCQSGYYHVTSSPYDWCAKNGTSSASPLTSAVRCNGPNWNRVWKGSDANGYCSRDCQPNYPVHIVADPYDYCKGGHTDHDDTNKITVNDKTSYDGEKLTFKLTKATELNYKVYGGAWKICWKTGTETNCQGLDAKAKGTFMAHANSTVWFVAGD